MKLSIIIPAYNEEAFISNCLDSVIAATKKFETEIIVVDNASTDKTASIVTNYPEVTLLHQPIKGTNNARQMGFEKATGELIANVDADNVITEKWMKKVFKVFANPKIVALSGPYRFYDLSPFHQILARTYYRLAYPFFVLFHKLFKKGGAVMGGNLVFRKKALEASHGYNTALAFYGDDTDTAQRLSKIGEVVFDYNFYVYSSGRRLNKQGIFYMAYKYFINYIWIIIFKKPFHKI